MAKEIFATFGCTSMRSPAGSVHTAAGHPRIFSAGDLLPMMFIKVSPNRHGFVNPRDINEYGVTSTDDFRQRFPLAEPARPRGY